MCFQKHEQHLKKQEIEGPFQLIFLKSVLHVLHGACQEMEVWFYIQV